MELSEFGPYIATGALGVLFFLWKERIKGAIKQEYDLKLKEIDYDYKTKFQQLEKEKEIAINEITMKLQTKLDIDRERVKRYYDEQFPKYNETWSDLCDLEQAAKNIWEAANRDNLEKLIKTFNNSMTSARKNSLLIERKHLGRLQNIFHLIDNLRIDKARLIELRERNSYDDYQAEELINQNRQTLESLIQDLKILMEEMHQHFLGTMHAEGN